MTKLNGTAGEQGGSPGETAGDIHGGDGGKGSFLLNLSQELRTPLTVLLGPIEEALSGGGSPLEPLDRGRVETARKAGLRLLKLVSTLLDFSRIEAGGLEAVYRPLDLASFTRDLVSAFRAAVERAGLRLVVDCPALSEAVYVDRDMWEKIVFNLLSNAFKFTSEGEIAVSVSVAGNQVELEVRDTGVGIPPEELPCLFQRFRQRGGRRARSGEGIGGTGVGLALVEELVKLHGGSISIQSVLGKGSAFTVSIPRGSSHLPPERVGAASVPVEAPPDASPWLEEALGRMPPARDGFPHWSGPGTAGVTGDRRREEIAGDRLAGDRLAGGRPATEPAPERLAAERQRDEFLSLVVHEIRNPLASIQLGLDTLRHCQYEEPTFVEARQVMVQNVQNLSRLLDHLFDLSSLGSGQELRRDRVNLSVVIQGARTALEPLLAKRGLKLSLFLPPEPLLVEGDPLRLEQIFSHLLQSAVRFSGGEGSFEIWARRQGGRAIAGVRSSALELPPQILSHIFDLFIPRSAGRSKAELCLELSLARKVVELHGGRVGASSAGPAGDGEIWLDLPLLPEASEAVEARPPRATPSRSSVLLVEDNADMAALFASVLRRWGHEVHVALDGPQALAEARAHHPGVVLVDLGLPGMDGYQVARELRGDAGLGNMLILALTGYGEEEHRRRSREAGFDHHLLKPVDFKVLEGLLAGTSERSAG